MQYKLFSIPSTGDADAEEDLNRFLRSHRAVSVEKELVQGGHTAYWCFCVEYLLNSPSPEGKGDGGGGMLRLSHIFQFLEHGQIDPESTVLGRNDFYDGIAADRRKRAFQPFVGVGRVVIPRFQQRGTRLGEGVDPSVDQSAAKQTDRILALNADAPECRLWEKPTCPL